MVCCETGPLFFLPFCFCRPSPFFVSASVGLSARALSAFLFGLCRRRRSGAGDAGTGTPAGLRTPGWGPLAPSGGHPSGDCPSGLRKHPADGGRTPTPAGDGRIGIGKTATSASERWALLPRRHAAGRPAARTGVGNVRTGCFSDGAKIRHSREKTIGMTEKGGKIVNS